MSNLGNFAFTAPLDPYKQPAFWVGNPQNYPGYGALVYDHYLNIIGRATNNENSYANVDGWDSSGGTEFNNNSGYSGQNSASGGGYYLQHTSANYLGHPHFELSTSPFLNGKLVVAHRGSNQASARRAWRYLGNIVRDINHDVVVLCGTDNRIIVAPRSPKIAGWMWEDNATYYNKFKSTTAPTGLLSSGYSMVEGGFSYNAETGTAIFMERSGYSHRPIVITGVRHPREFVYKSDEFVAHIAARIAAGARYVTSGHQDKPTNQGTEDNQRGVPVICDTGDIYYFQMITNWGYTVARWKWNGTTITEALTGNESNNRLHSRSWTTSYGIADDENVGGGATWNVSNDGTQMMMYCNAYYYHSGMYGCYVDIITGRIVYDYYWHDSSFSKSIVPIQKNKWLALTGDNCDSGVGLRASILEFEQEWSYAGRNGTSNAFCRRQGDHWTWQHQTYWLNSPGYTTAYPQVNMCEYDKTSVARKEW